MATESIMIRDGAQTAAGADLSSSQFLAVKLSTSADRQVVLESTGGVQIYGILQNKPTSGQVADVCLFGISKAVVGAAVTRGDRLMTNSSGQLITATSTNIQVAQALESATGSGQIISVFVTGGGGYKTP